MSFRIGFGFDVHQLELGERIVLGGVHLPSSQQSVGHSDADVLLHALSDAILGAANLGDIGHLFPNTDESIRGIDSRLILARCMEEAMAKGYSLGNADLTLVLESPKIAPHLEKMKEAISEVLRCAINQISIKATTNEKLGFIGRKEGLAAYAVVLLEKSV